MNRASGGTKRSKSCRALMFFGVLLFILSMPLLSFALAVPIANCLPLSAPTGNVRTVSTEAALQAAFDGIQSGDTIFISQGTYRLTRSLNLDGVTGVVIRGVTGNRDDVVLAGPGMNDPSMSFGFWLRAAENITFSDFTLTDISEHAFILNAGTEAPTIRNVRMVDVGDQFIKANPDGSGGGVDNGIVECSAMEYTTIAPDWYTNGVDVHTGKGWIIRNNLFKNIRGPIGQAAGPAILMWNRSQDSVSEGNLFLNCERGIAYGLDSKIHDHQNGIIRNNFFYRSASESGDVAISVTSSPGTKVLNNTLIMSGTFQNAIEYRFNNTINVEIVNNLTDAAIQGRDGASAEVFNNLINAQNSWFLNPALGDLHLLPAVAAAIDQALPRTEITRDYDGESRPTGASPDIGADEVSVSDISEPSAPRGLSVE